jgi:ferritin
MISKNLEEAINRQLNRELYSMYLYLSMSDYFESKSMKGFASWMRVQAREELYHTMKFFDYVHERGGKVKMYDVEAPPSKWPSPLKVFEEGLKHERLVTRLIKDLMDVANKEKDHAAVTFLQWYVSEQVEEESTFGEILDKLKLMGKGSDALPMLDREITTRHWKEPDPTNTTGL